MKLCVQIDIHNDHGIGNLHVCKQCSSCKTTNKQPQAIHYDRDIDGHVTHSRNNQSR